MGPAVLNMFARSPIRPLQKHMAKACDCAELLTPFFKAVLANDWDDASALRNKISQAENEADDLKLDIRVHLPKSLLLPVPRSDILALLSKQEKVANTSKDIAGIVLGRQMQIPSQLAEQFTQYLEQSIAAAQQAKKAISELDELLEAGFRGKEISVVETLVSSLNTIEHESDQMQVKLRKSLYDLEKELHAVDVMFLYKIIDRIGVLADSAEEVGSCLQTLTAH